MSSIEQMLAAMGARGPQPEPSPEYQKAVEEFHQASIDMFIRDRADLVRWAGIYCRCKRGSGWLTPEGFEPPQAECIVHGQVPMLPDGTVLR